MDPDDIETICNSVCKPGGMVVLVAGAPPIPNPGVSVTALFQPSSWLQSKQISIGTLLGPL